MCGIAGIFKFNGDPTDLATIKAMSDAIAHRGPDGEGYFVEESIALGHKRLAIIDITSTGDQPMTSGNGQWVIVFNGCIYNFKSLRKDLEKLGHEFKGTSDTEVITEGLAEHGPSFFKELDGMFAIAAWNKKEKKLYLSRDRFAIKPLYYWFSDKELVFASEIKAILKYPGYKMELDYRALNEYFSFQNIFRYITFFKGINMLPAANTIELTRDSRHILHESWWDYDFTEPDNSLSFEDAVQETKRLLENAVQRQMVADVPVGSYLSGGMDSGSLTALASQHVSRLSTFTAGFELSNVDGPEATFDERMDAELVANHFKTEHYEQVINAGDLRWSLPRVVWHIEDLKVGMSYPNYYISRLASKFVKVCLQGTGGDELYGGYPWRYYRVFKSLNQNEFFDNYYGFWQRLVPDNEKIQLFQSSVFKEIDIAKPREIFERVFTFNKKLKYNTPEEHIQNSLYFEIKTFLPGLLLVGDKLSMANGLEERFPFLDNEMIEFAQKIPVKYKLGNLEKMKQFDENEFQKKQKVYQEYDDGKNVLRMAVKDILPDKIINRKKQGFSAPDESWYRGENASYVKELLFDKNAAYQEFIDPKYVRAKVDEHINDRINHRLMLWSFMNFEWWCKLFLNGESFE
ncbi:MAG: asparagine synthase (glutamine-hydrolyzing) [Bacteroidetes bacterium]|nr:asparagine synthase (glutamine-hydrolyzing) [Bacteroidota bacterium]